MLSQIKIRNLALVDELDWQLSDGLLGVTGETGAGKSVIVGALKLILGERAEKSLIRTGEETCSVEAVFDLKESAEVDAILEELGFESCEDGLLIIKRSFSARSNRQFVNNSPATVSTLKALGKHLVDLHGPHDHQSLLATDKQLTMLDAYAGSRDLAEKYRSAWADWRAKVQELASLEASERESSQQMDLLRFQVEEIDAAELRPEEEEEIEARYKRSANASRLVDSAAAIQNLLGGEDGVTARLAEVQRLAGDLRRMDEGTADLLSGLEGAVLELSELESGVEDYVSDLDLDPAEATELERRVSTFDSLKRKYGATLEEVIEHRDEAAERLHRIENRGEIIEKLASEVVTLREKVDAQGAKLTLRRKRSAPKLAKEIVAHLNDLGFRQALFEIALVREEEPTAQGLEGVEFEFGPNPGEPIKPLRNIASSGEVSRVMLAVKSALADQDATPLMVFDEIDANVGGEIARAVGDKMAVLGQGHQVVAITHFPQVAAIANAHYVVSKAVQKGRTLSTLKPVGGESRLDELVRMLGGGGEEAREMAKSLLKGDFALGV